jgi:hypothetical protein
MGKNSFSHKSTNDIMMIIGAGGGVIVDAAMKSTNDLMMIAGTARSNGVTITLRGLNMKSTNDLMMIGGAGKGFVRLEG